MTHRGAAKGAVWQLTQKNRKSAQPRPLFAQKYLLDPTRKQPEDKRRADL